MLRAQGNDAYISWSHELFKFTVLVLLTLKEQWGDPACQRNSERRGRITAKKTTANCQQQEHLYIYSCG